MRLSPDMGRTTPGGRIQCWVSQGLPRFPSKGDVVLYAGLDIGSSRGILKYPLLYHPPSQNIAQISYNKALSGSYFNWYGGSIEEASLEASEMRLHEYQHHFEVYLLDVQYAKIMGQYPRMESIGSIESIVLDTLKV